MEKLSFKSYKLSFIKSLRLQFYVSLLLISVLYMDHKTLLACRVTMVTVPTKASGEDPVRKSSSPFIIHEPLVSPGWTLAVTTTARFAW